MKKMNNHNVEFKMKNEELTMSDLDRKREYHYETIDKCWHCKGTGKVTVVPVRKFMGRVLQKEKTCSICNGSGRVRKKKKVIIALEPYYENEELKQE